MCLYVCVTVCPFCVADIHLCVCLLYSLSFVQLYILFEASISLCIVRECEDCQRMYDVFVCVCMCVCV